MGWSIVIHSDGDGISSATSGLTTEEAIKYLQAVAKDYRKELKDKVTSGEGG